MINSWFRALTLMLALFAVMTAAACGEMDPNADPRLGQADPSGRILFAAGGNIHLWDGSIQQLTDVGNASSPEWGADGQQYMFVRRGDAFSDLAIGNVETGGVQNLTSNQPNLTPGTDEYLDQVLWTLDPTWAADGSGVAYVSDAGTESNFLWYLPSLEESPWRVPCSQRRNDNVERPDFSPDGSQVVFAQRSSNQQDLERWMELRICDLNTGEMTELVEGEAGDAAFFPRWSPDGEWIAFVRRLEGGTDIWVVPAEGGDPVQLTEMADVTAPEWSPDGSQLAFMDPDGASFRAMYVDFQVDENGNPSVSDPAELFDVDGIDAPSGLSWTE